MPLPRTTYIYDLYDIYNASDKQRFWLFADDTNLLYADKKVRSFENTLNIEPFDVYNW